MQNLPQTLEAILFVSGEKESLKKLEKLLETDQEKIEKALELLQKNYQNRGLKILKEKDTIQLVSDPQYAKSLEKYWQKSLREKLSRISLETLTIIAYQGPIARFQIEEIRGVNSVFVLRSLLRRGLISRKSQGNRTYYQITADFLRHLGLTRISQLPNYSQFKKNHHFK